MGACGTSPPANVETLRDIAGDTVPGTKGKTIADQERIDEHVARMCETKLYIEALCEAHTVASAKRREELRQESTSHVDPTTVPNS